MRSPKLGLPTMSDAAADLRAVYGPGARKRVARDAHASVETVKRWFAEGIPARRRRQIAEVILRRIDEQQQALAEIRTRAIEALREDLE